MNEDDTSAMSTDAPACCPKPAAPLDQGQDHLQDQGMVWIPGGTFRMGSDRHYREESPTHRVAVDGFWMDAVAVTNEQFRRFVAATGYVTVAERPLDPVDYPGALPGMLQPGALVFHKASRPVDLRNLANWWSYVPGANWRNPEGAGAAESTTARTHPVVPRRVRGCRGLCPLGREDAAHGGRMGVRRAWRPGRHDLLLGRRVHAGRPPHGQHVARAVSLAKSGVRRVRAHRSGRFLPRQRLRPVRHGGQCVGVDLRLVQRPASGRRGQALLHSEQPTRRPAGEQPRPGPAQHPHSAQGGERGLVPVRP
ncbi:protein of unknown function (plasmid) [Azospirillum baldaniorum]|uniref:Sulfatase-modifying factor enzyme-like domain-containing protein n=1 Tax=Azospirillum baldaniorum TaxID=1064539 RepID=A0A9P1JXT7_9PROT|nr:protein of unknown function [Azospirillum baldaniorum]